MFHVDKMFFEMGGWFPHLLVSTLETCVALTQSAGMLHMHKWRRRRKGNGGPFLEVNTLIQQEAPYRKRLDEWLEIRVLPMKHD